MHQNSACLETCRQGCKQMHQQQADSHVLPAERLRLADDSARELQQNLPSLVRLLQLLRLMPASDKQSGIVDS